MLEFLKFKPWTYPQVASDEELWKAKRLIDSSVHPYTGEPIFPLFRMGAFTPVNIPICYAMINFTSPWAQLFVHWMNQVNMVLKKNVRNSNNCYYYYHYKGG